MHELAGASLLLLGAFFMLTASIGALRMPDLFMRMSAASKGSSLGAALALTGVAVYFADAQITARTVATIVFVFLTVPVGSHMVGRAGYLSRVRISANTRVDELKGRYDPETSELAGRRGP